MWEGIPRTKKLSVSEFMRFSIYTQTLKIQIDVSKQKIKLATSIVAKIFALPLSL